MLYKKKKKYLKKIKKKKTMDFGWCVDEGSFVGTNTLPGGDADSEGGCDSGDCGITSICWEPKHS